MNAGIQIGIDSFAAAHDDTSRALSPTQRLRHLIEEIEHADQVAAGRVSVFSGTGQWQD